MKIREIREMSKEKALETLASTYRRESVIRMKFGQASDKKNTAELGKVKKTIARILTVLKENERSEVVS
jgi:ribosomal protein L29